MFFLENFRHRTGFVDAAADRGGDALGDVDDVGVVAEFLRCQFQPAMALDVNLIWSVDQNVGDCLVGQQRFDRADAEHVVEQLVDHLCLFLRGDADAVAVDQLGHDALDVHANLVAGLEHRDRDIHRGKNGIAQGAEFFRTHQEFVAGSRGRFGSFRDFSHPLDRDRCPQGRFGGGFAAKHDDQPLRGIRRCQRVSQLPVVAVASVSPPVPLRSLPSRATAWANGDLTGSGSPRFSAITTARAS